MRSCAYMHYIVYADAGKSYAKKGSFSFLSSGVFWLRGFGCSDMREDREAS